MKVLLTGGNGLLGHNIIQQLIAENHKITAIVRNPENVLIKHPNLNIHKGSFANYEQPLESAEGCDAIIHAASATDMSLNYDEFYAVNVKGSETVIAVAERLNINTIVYISTLNTIGYGTPEHPSDETAEMQEPFTQSYYAITKKEAENLFIEASKKKDRHIIIINPGFMIGAYDTKPSSGQLLLMAYKKPIMIAPSGGKSFVHVKDVATAATNALTMGRNGEKYIATTHGKTLFEFYTLQKQICQYRQILITIPGWITNGVGLLGDLLHKVGIKTQVCRRNTRQLCVKEYYNNSKAKKELKLPETTLEQAISDSIYWLKKNA